MLIPKQTIENYKKAIKNHIGDEISLSLKKGRRTITINNCIIESAYESIFVVKICGESLLNTSKISVCYADLLIGNARVCIPKDVKPA